MIEKTAVDTIGLTVTLDVLSPIERRALRSAGIQLGRLYNGVWIATMPQVETCLDAVARNIRVKSLLYTMRRVLGHKASWITVVA